MEITSLQELAHCREQILLLRNHQVLLCQAGEHWGKNSTIFYKKIHNFKEKMFMWLKCINPCCVTFSMWHYPLHTHFGSYFLEQNPKWICLFYNLYYNILCISYMCKWALFIFYLLIPFFFKKTHKFDKFISNEMTKGFRMVLFTCIYSIYITVLWISGLFCVVRLGNLQLLFPLLLATWDLGALYLKYF